MYTAHASVTQTHRVLSLDESVILHTRGREADASALLLMSEGF